MPVVGEKITHNTIMIHLSEIPKMVLESFGVQILFAIVSLIITEFILKSYFARRKIQTNSTKFNVLRHEILWSALTFGGGSIIKKIIDHGTDDGWIVMLSTTEVDFAPSFFIRWMVEVVTYFVIFDAIFYYGHKYLHTNRFLFQWIHSQHHVSKSPNVVTGYSFHPIEGVGFGLFLPFFCCMMTQIFGGVLKVSFMTCGFIQVVQSLIIHSGYDIVPPKWFDNPYTSFVLTSTFHDRHHEISNCNYSGFFTWLDDYHGTSDGQNWRQKYSQWQREGRPTRPMKPSSSSLSSSSNGKDAIKKVD